VARDDDGYRVMMVRSAHGADGLRISDCGGNILITAGFAVWNTGQFIPNAPPELRSSQGLRVESGERRVCEGTQGSWQSSAPHGKLRIGMPSNALAQGSDSIIAEKLALDFETVEFELKYVDAYSKVMQILCCAELCNNISRYDGIKFGYRAEGYRDLKELYTKSRTEAFGADVKLAAMAGAMVLSQGNYIRYYDKAMRVRRLIKESLDFDAYDIIAIPAALRALPQLCGLPALTIPLSSGAVTLVADAGREDVLAAVSGQWSVVSGQ
jgi:Asp-tRNA(Asn)/Glu-tRNA(Gln) amidotransferase A subunit family amidase